MGTQRSDWSRSGIAALSTILFLAGIATELSVVGAFLSFMHARTGLSARNLIEANAVARAGVQDAVLRLTRDKNFTSAGYTIAAGSASATVTVAQNSNIATITSVGTSFSSKRKLQALVSVNEETSEVLIYSLKEQAM